MSRRLTWILLLLLAAQARAETAPPTSDESPQWFDALYINAGYSHAYADKNHHLGGVALDEDLDSSGLGGSLGVVFAPNRDYLRPYADFAYLSHDDRDFQILGGGVRYDFNNREKALNPFLSAGAGGLAMAWDNDPVNGSLDRTRTGKSFAITLQSGLEWRFSPRVGLDLRLRYDLYDVSTTVVNNSSVTQIDDRASLSLLAGLVFRHPKPDGDEDQDGVRDSLDQCSGTQQLVPVDEVGCPLQAFDFDLEFEFAGFQIRNMIYKPTFPVVAFLKRNPDYHVRITGHTDSVGSTEFNQTLSEQRANKARDFLIENGIAAERIETIGMGETSPIASNETEYGRQQNRRINAYFFAPAKTGEISQ